MLASSTRNPRGSWVWLVSVEKAHSTFLSAGRRQVWSASGGGVHLQLMTAKQGDTVRREASKRKQERERFRSAFRSNVPW